MSLELLDRGVLEEYLRFLPSSIVKIILRELAYAYGGL